MDNETSQIVDYEGVLWMGLHFGLAWAAYAQWIMIFVMDFIRIGLRKLQFVNFGACQISDDAKSLGKIPNHLAIITEEDASLQDLANIVLWTVLLGVSCITIHCRNGMNAAVFDEFVRTFDRSKRDVKSILKINFHNERQLSTEDLTGCNVIISSVVWSRHKLVEAARALSNQVRSGKIRSSEINLQLVNNTVRDASPEPDLAISFSSHPSLHGFNPWDTRLTEILTMPSAKNIQYPQFLNTMKQFAKTKQRFGK